MLPKCNTSFLIKMLIFNLYFIFAQILNTNFEEILLLLVFLILIFIVLNTAFLHQREMHLFLFTIKPMEITEPKMGPHQRSLLLVWSKIENGAVTNIRH